MANNGTSGLPWAWLIVQVVADGTFSIFHETSHVVHLQVAIEANDQRCFVTIGMVSTIGLYKM